MQGLWEVQPASGREVRIIGMRNTSGSIIGQTPGVLRSTKVWVMDSHFPSGALLFDADAYVVNVVGCTLESGFVRINFGNVIGNDVNSTGSTPAIRLQPVSTSFAGDTAVVMANKAVSGTGAIAILVNTSAQVHHIRNNWVRHAWKGIEARAGSGAFGTINQITNNSVQGGQAAGGALLGIVLASTGLNTVWELMNNAIGSENGSSDAGIFRDAGVNGQVNVFYNHVNAGMATPISAGFTFASNNTLDQPVTFNADGTFLNAPSAIDGGNPAPALYDLDLSVGDAGASGGSYTLSNFFPLHAGAARVYMTGHPFNARQGSTLRIRANAFDR